MEYEVLEALDYLRYAENLNEEEVKRIVNDNVRYSKLLEWICNELKSSINLEESITHVQKDEDLSSFHMELSSLLKELGCPYELVMNGSLDERFSGEDRRLLVLTFLLTELQAARISYVNNHKQLKVEFAESHTARLLRQMLQALGVPKPSDNIAMPALLSKVNERITDIRKKMTPQLIDKPIFVGVLSENQWAQVEQLNSQFQEEYILRREMLLKRLDVTVQSFHWSDRLKNKKDEINRIFREKRAKLQAKPNVTVGDILAARCDLALLEKTSCASVRAHTKSAVNKVVIGKVPDRGGRTNEIVPPPPEMPPWQQRQGGGGHAPGGQGWSQGPQQQRDYGAGRGPRGGSQQPKVQGGWSGGDRGGGGRGGGGNYNNYQQQQQQSYGHQNDQYSSQQSHHQQQSYGGGYQQQQPQHYQHDNRYQDNQQQQHGGYGGRDGYQGRGGGRGGGGGGNYRGGGHRGRGHHQY